MEKGALVHFTGGKYIGKIGNINEIKDGIIFVKIDDKDIQTSKKYAFVIGDKKLSITMDSKNEQDERN